MLKRGASSPAVSTIRVVHDLLSVRGFEPDTPHTYNPLESSRYIIQAGVLLGIRFFICTKLWYWCLMYCAGC